MSEIETRTPLEEAQAMLIEGLEKLLTAYRIGGRPSEATFTKIARARADIEKIKGRTAAPEGDAP